MGSPARQAIFFFPGKYEPYFKGVKLFQTSTCRWKEHRAPPGIGWKGLPCSSQISVHLRATTWELQQARTIPFPTSSMAAFQSGLCLSGFRPSLCLICIFILPLKIVKLPKSGSGSPGYLAFYHWQLATCQRGSGCSGNVC